MSTNKPIQGQLPLNGKNPPWWSKHVTQLYDLLCRSLGTGNFPVAVGAVALLCLAVWVGRDATKLLISEFIGSRAWASLGWILLGASICSCYMLLRWQRNIQEGEIARLSQEKKELQEKLTGAQLSTSKQTPT